ncbi:MAG: cadherin-like domain-containing protein, partial [Deltaproteobacteria bacterium]|nr:cadherin-like domain-containing protein [Deltaproteobacteria bacterium]
MQKGIVVGCLFLSFFSISMLAMEPVVAIHVSELTQALETITAQAPTPIGSGTTGYEWWTPWWHYCAMLNSLEEALRSDGTGFVVVSDADIAAGALLLPDGTPRYPILISLASEAIRNDEIDPLRAYVAAGGFLFVGSSSFTRNPDGTGRGDFALASEMGLHSATSGLDNWELNWLFSKAHEHRLVSHIPSGILRWRMPMTDEDISWGISPAHYRSENHYYWRVSVGDATIHASLSGSPYILSKAYGLGRFIYHAAMQPLKANGGPQPGMYAYMIFRNAIEWAFEAAQLPLVRLSPWPYPYNAAYVMRHDLENHQFEIGHIETCAANEYSLGATGDYYFCTGTLREEMGEPEYAIQSLRNAVSLYGATIGSHNGGLRNPNNPGLPMSDYEYWHWGLDEALDTNPDGYSSGIEYARTSMSLSLNDIDRWLDGIQSNKRTWVSPYFNSNREESFQILEQLGLTIGGEQKISPFPHWTVSTQTPGRRYSYVQLPVSDWFINGEVAQCMDDHPSVSTVHALIDYYYDIGTLINCYTHLGMFGGLPWEYLEYCATKASIWSSNGPKIYDWWVRRSPVQFTSNCSIIGNTMLTTINITGAVDTETAVELSIPNWTAVSNSVNVTLNGLPASTDSYRTYHQGIKIKVGSSISTVQVSYQTNGPIARNDTYSMNQGSTLNVSAPGVLTNDSANDGSSFSASLESSVSHGSLSFHADGSFTYVPDVGFNGTDVFTYLAISDEVPSNSATVSILVLPAALLTGVSVNPVSVLGGSNSTGTVALDSPAPVAGAMVQLTSSDAAAEVPASVTIEAGQTTATFPVTTSPVAA